MFGWINLYGVLWECETLHFLLSGYKMLRRKGLWELKVYVKWIILSGMVGSWMEWGVPAVRLEKLVIGVFSRNLAVLSDKMGRCWVEVVRELWMLRNWMVIGFGDMVGNCRKGKRMENGGKLKFFKDEWDGWTIPFLLRRYSLFGENIPLYPSSLNYV